MSYGVFQEYFTEDWTLEGSQSVTGMVTNSEHYISLHTHS